MCESVVSLIRERYNTLLIHQLLCTAMQHFTTHTLIPVRERGV
jgi:hypothetical protein